VRLLSLAALLLVASAAMAVEEAAYETVEDFGDFELRRYAPLIHAEVEVDASFERAGSQAFPILAGYIGGRNRSAEKVAMTAPVIQASGGERIAMTAPVNQAPAPAGGGRYVVSFVMPAGFTLDTLPRPTDPRVRLRAEDSRLVAARRYSGRWTRARYADEEQRLLEAVAAAGLEVTGVPEYARYNPPWMPWFLRRNEVLVEVAAAPR
jgi:hypothetical protein